MASAIKSVSINSERTIAVIFIIGDETLKTAKNISINNGNNPISKKWLTYEMEKYNRTKTLEFSSIYFKYLKEIAKMTIE